MRTLHVLIVLVSGAALAAPAPPRPAAAREAPVAGAPGSPAAEVWQTIEGFNRAFAANDPESYFRFIDDDVVVLTPSNPYRVEGIADDREEFELGLRQGYGRIGYFQELQPRVDLFGVVAVVTYFSRGRYGADERAASHYLKETDVLVRRDGVWKIVHIHVSATAGG